MVFVDYLTKGLEVLATGDQAALTIAKLLVEHVISHHGIPPENHHQTANSIVKGS